jgi:hypothetical protein
MGMLRGLGRAVTEATRQRYQRDLPFVSCGQVVKQCVPEFSGLAALPASWGSAASRVAPGARPPLALMHGLYPGDRDRMALGN